MAHENSWVEMNRYGVAIQGAGNISRQHIGAYNRNPHTEVVAIGDIDEARAKARAREYRLSCTIYTDYDGILADPRVDIISICTPNHRHASETVGAIQAGKHVLIEKPVVTTPEDLTKLQDAVATARVKTAVGFVTRYMPLFKTIKALLEDDAIGRVFMAEVDYWYRLRKEAPQYQEWWTKKEMTGGPVLSTGCYAVDAIRWFVGSEVREVTACSVRGANPDPDYDPTVLAILRFENGAIGKVSACMEAEMPYLLNVELLGDKGTIRNNLLYSHKFPDQSDFMAIPVELPGADMTRIPFQAEIDHFVDCIINDIESPVNLEDGLKTHEVCLAIDLSAAHGMPITLPLPEVVKRCQQ